MPTSLGPAEILVILVVALIVLGPKRLPEAGRQVGKAISEVRKWSQTFQDEIRGTLDPDAGRPTYSQPQPGYDPGPIPMVPAETAPPADTAAPADADVPSIPIVPAETGPPADAGASTPPADAGASTPPADAGASTPPADAGASTQPATPSPPAGAGAEVPSQPAETNGAGVRTGSNGLVSGSAPIDSGPVDWADEPTYTDPAPTEPSGPTAGDPPRT